MSVEPVPSIGTGRCGCADDSCACDVISSESVIVTGDGSAGDPYVFDLVDPEVFLNVVDTATVNLTKAGTGVPGDPIHISGTATPAGVTVDEFFGDGTYNVPATASMLSIKCVAGGGGGGGGSTTATGGRGGGGGQGGGITEMLINTAQVGATLAVEVGGGGSGGTGAASGGGTGVSGNNGNPSYVEDGVGNAVCYAAGGEGGSATEGGNNASQSGTMTGGYGASPVDSGTQSAAPATCVSTSGGGAGASHTAASAVIAPSDGGDRVCLGISGGAAPGGAGTDGAGGGGGAVGAAGGSGGTYGGGGGGGGGRVTGAGAAGAGGNGAQGYVVITAW